MPKEPSTLLVRLVNEWNQEIPIFEMRSVNFHESAKNLSRINREIWKQCQEEGIDQDSLGMINTKEYEKQKQAEPTGRRKPKAVRSGGDANNK